MDYSRRIAAGTAALVISITTACSTNPTNTTATASSLEQEYAAKLKALEEREASLSARERSIKAKASASATTAMATGGDNLLPPNAKAGECYARIWVPPRFRTVTEKVLKRAESEQVQVIPAKYETVTERVLVREASEKLVPTPATYKTVTEKVLLEPEHVYWTFGTNGPKSALGKHAKRVDEERLAAAKAAGMPSDMEVGQCYAEYYKPARFEERSERVLVDEGGQKVQVIPAKYETVTERVLVREASEKLVTVPAKYETVTEKVLVRPAYTTWKVSECSGGACVVGAPNAVRVPGVRERIDQDTGEVMCLVEIPAQYKTVTKRVMVSPPTTKKVVIPAEYKTVKVRKMVSPPQEKIISTPEQFKTITKRVQVEDADTAWYLVNSSQAAEARKNGYRPTGEVFCKRATPARYKTVTKRVMVTPASTRKVEIPAEYKTVKVRKMVTPPQEKRITIPAEYQTVTRKEKISDGHMEWLPVLCQANMTKSKIREVQMALQKKGYYDGPVDGVVGPATISAMQKFERDNDLTVSIYLTTEALKALGIKTS
jgi:hypothetical protein